MMVSVLERSASGEVLSDSPWRRRKKKRSILQEPAPLTDITSDSRPTPIPFGASVMLFFEAPPTWLRDLLARISELGDLDENWDSYGARPVQPECAVTAAVLLLDFIDRDTPKPSVVPTNRGGVQLEWHRAGADLEVEIESPGRMRVFFEDEQVDERQEFTLTSDLQRLVPLLQRVSRTD